MSGTIIVIPCYNEAWRLDVERFAHVASVPEIRFLFVDDGSTDGTAARLASLRDGDPEAFHVRSMEHNVGKAEAVRHGMLEAAAMGPESVGYWDADLSTGLEEIERFRSILAERPEIQMAFGARVNLLGRRIRRRLTRHYVGRVFATVTAWVLRLSIYDTQCGAKLFRNTAELREVFARPFVSRWIFDVEVIARYIHGRRGTDRPPVSEIIYEIPLHAWFDVAGSKLRLRDLVVVSVDFMRIMAGFIRRSR